MTHSVRPALRLVAIAAFAITIAVSTWLLLMPPGGRAADCATARAMWTYYESQLGSARAAAQESDANNTKTEAAYQNMINGLQSYADRIATPAIRSEADTIVAINRDMFEQWKRWVAQSQAESTISAGSTPSDRQFGVEFAESAKDSVTPMRS